MSMTAFDQDYVPSPDARPIYARPTGERAALLIGGGALLILLASLAFGGKRPAEEARADAAPAPVSSPKIANQAETSLEGLVKDYAAFDLRAPEFAKEKRTTSTRQIEPGAGREDSLTLGQFTSGGPYMRLDIRQSTGEKTGAPDFFLDMTRHAIAADLSVARIGQPGALGSRFGNFEAADIRLAPASASAQGAERSCLAVRLVNVKLSLEIAGVACGTAARPFDRREMSCILDRLDYQSNGDNKALDSFFLNAELERGKACPEGAMSPTASKANWIDAHSSTPALKTDAPAAKHPRKKAAEKKAH